MKANITAKQFRPPAFWDDGDRPGLTEQPDFVAYSKLVLKIVSASPVPVNIGDIHRGLGSKMG